MNKAKLIFNISIASLLMAQCADAQNKDTVTISAANLKFDNLKFGQASYLVYNKKTKDSYAEGMYLVNINIESINYKLNPAIKITQQWEGKDTIIHRAYTVINRADYSTRLHQTSWKGLKYKTSFDFDEQKVYFEGVLADSNKLKIVSDFDKSFSNYNLNWHSDLFIFTRLPYKINRSFRINFFDPGFGAASEEIYTVTGDDLLTTSSGKKIRCWVMERKGKVVGSYQKFWIDKKNSLVLKEEDLFNNRYRFKKKMEIAGNN